MHQKQTRFERLWARCVDHLGRAGPQYKAALVQQWCSLTSSKVGVWTVLAMWQISFLTYPYIWLFNLSILDAGPWPWAAWIIGNHMKCKFQQSLTLRCCRAPCTQQGSSISTMDKRQTTNGLLASRMPWRSCGAGWCQHVSTLLLSWVVILFLVHWKIYILYTLEMNIIITWISLNHSNDSNDSSCEARFKSICGSGGHGCPCLHPRRACIGQGMPTLALVAEAAGGLTKRTVVFGGNSERLRKAMLNVCLNMFDGMVFSCFLVVYFLNINVLHSRNPFLAARQCQFACIGSL